MVKLYVENSRLTNFIILFIHTFVLEFIHFERDVGKAR